MKNAVLTFRTTHDHLAKLDAAARYLGKSRSELLADIVEQFLNRNVDEERAGIAEINAPEEDQS